MPVFDENEVNFCVAAGAADDVPAFFLEPFLEAVLSGSAVTVVVDSFAHSSGAEKCILI